MNLPNLATDKYRWLALIILALSLAIIIIDNTVLNVAVPYILRDLNASLDSIQWVISGYALIIATLIITVGRVGDILGRKKVFLLGTIFFAIGSFIASIAPNATILFLGEALIEAIGASMMMTSSLSLIASEFQGKERAIAFGIWGSIAGFSASIGPLLGGYLTTYYSWRWSLRINVIVALIAILGSIFIKEAKGEGESKFDWLGTVLSGAGMFLLIFGFIEGRKYGWITPAEQISLLGWQWPLSNISVIPVIFLLSLAFILYFIFHEISLERNGGSPLVRMSIFKSRGLSFGLITLTIASLGQFGMFFVLPIYLQSVIGLSAFQTGLYGLPSSIFALVIGATSGFIASKIGSKWLVSIGMLLLASGDLLIIRALNTNITWWTLAPGLALFGMGIGASSAQLTNLILSSAPIRLAGETSALNSTVRQIGTSIGSAIIGTILASTLTTNMTYYVRLDYTIPEFAKDEIINSLQKITPESGQKEASNSNMNSPVAQSIKSDVNKAIVDSAKLSVALAMLFILSGGLFSLLIPNVNHPERSSSEKSD